MKIAEVYSHLNGEEYLLVHKPALYTELRQILTGLHANRHRTKVSKEARMLGKMLFAPTAINAAYKRLFRRSHWHSEVYSYYVTTNRAFLDQVVNLPLAEQARFLKSKGIPSPIRSYKQTDFVKDEVAVEVQFGKYPFVAYDLFVKHLLFYSGGLINVGVEVLPMKAMTQPIDGPRTMSSGIAYFEGEVYNVMRHGRSNPPVPLVIIGLMP
jgi:hypothetical protein